MSVQNAAPADTRNPAWALSSFTAPHSKSTLVVVVVVVVIVFVVAVVVVVAVVDATVAAVILT